MRKKVGKKFISTIVQMIVLIGCTNVFAAPSWRGDERTTYEQWSFTKWNYGPLAPDDGWTNPYGDPYLCVASGSQWSATVNDHSGVWALAGMDGFLIDIANYPVTSESKNLWIELVWKGANRSFVPDKPILGIETDVSYTDMIVERTDTPIGNGWIDTLYKYQIWPNPAHEWISLGGDIYVDQIVVDTKCNVPEPAAMTLLGLGALLGLGRRRRV